MTKRIFVRYDCKGRRIPRNQSVLIPDELEKEIKKDFTPSKTLDEFLRKCLAPEHRTEEIEITIVNVAIKEEDFPDTVPAIGKTSPNPDLPSIEEVNAMDKAALLDLAKKLGAGDLKPEEIKQADVLAMILDKYAKLGLVPVQ